MNIAPRAEFCPEGFVLCHQCGSAVDASEGSCANCGAELTVTKRLKLAESRGLRISQELKAVRLDQQLFPPGEEIAGRFVLGEMIGKGPFGEVYRARDKAIDAEVAVKIFAADVLQTPLDEERFLQATRAGRRLNQPNVVRLHDAGVHKSHPFVSMQLLEGLSLRKVLDLRRSKGETFTLQELEPIVSQITLALQHVSRDFPHGDLKPENIVFLPDLIKVTDSFVLAALPARAIIGRLKQNPYFAPELHTEKSEPTVQADVYSVGVIIGEMMFGPDHTPGTRSDDGVLGAIDALVKRATAFDPRERYPTVEALSEDLATVIDTGSLLDTSRPPAPPPAPGAPIAGASAPPAPPRPAMDVEEALGTEEYSRDLDAKLQDSILTREAPRKSNEDAVKTREVGRSPRRPVGRTVTAAVPKPAGPIPAPRPVESDASLRVGVVVLAVLLVMAGVVYAMSKRTPEVEELGVKPVATKPQAVAPTPVPAPEVPPTKVEPSAASSLVAAAQVSAVAAATNAGTTEVTPKVAPAPVDARPAVEKDDPKSGGRTPTNTNDSTGAPAPVKGSDTKTDGTDCPGGMRLLKSKKQGNVCVDTYEFPGGGVKPKTNVSWFQAKKHCESQGKRLCKLSEWRSACGSGYPYGSTHDANKCNTADGDGFERALGPTGSFKECRSRVGTFDMVGNAHEWVEEQRIAGGGFESDEAVGSCKYSSPKSPASSAGYIGFRCCKSAD